jgi:hypothetical protein
VADAASGFRAYSREMALHLNILTRYSYTLETIIQAGKMGRKVISVPVEIKAPTRPSRLQRNMWHFIKAAKRSVHAAHWERWSRTSSVDASVSSPSRYAES